MVLTGTALLAPADQIHLHTATSFQKHIGFGLFFAAPMAGVGLARIIGDHFRRAQLGVAVWGLCLMLGMVQANDIFNSWANARPLVAELSRYLQPGAHYLVEAAEVPTYYLRRNPDAKASQFVTTYFISYTGQNGITLTGDAGFEAAVRQGYFHVIAYDDTVTVPLDQHPGPDAESRPLVPARRCPAQLRRRRHLLHLGQALGAPGWPTGPGPGVSRAGSPRSRRPRPGPRGRCAAGTGR